MWNAIILAAILNAIVPFCSGEFDRGVMTVSLAICDDGSWCEKEEYWLYDECGNLVDYGCTIYSVCGSCPLSCEEGPEPEPRPYPDIQQE
jgi:hypothetical protein